MVHFGRLSFGWEMRMSCPIVVVGDFNGCVPSLKGLGAPPGKTWSGDAPLWEVVIEDMKIDELCHSGCRRLQWVCAFFKGLRCATWDDLICSTLGGCPLDGFLL
ncbi:hypothetical protein JCGZ_18592 [Jatropha curcas]|uniref:Uncharacterized protein n=1 Tax=Jatropha curcas TaxID=180498 RepID=A0A067KCQ3_JATCU|nr:hypothetical protein JCGZ_18592 [Jatropha curcas]